MKNDTLVRFMKAPEFKQVEERWAADEYVHGIVAVNASKVGTSGSKAGSKGGGSGEGSGGGSGGGGSKKDPGSSPILESAESPEEMEMEEVF